MTVTQLDLDDRALAAAMRRMGTKTKTETVNRALQEYVRRFERLEAAERLAERGARGEFDEAAEAHAAARHARVTAHPAPLTQLPVPPARTPPRPPAAGGPGGG